MANTMTDNKYTMTDLTSNYLPYFYKPKKTSKDTILSWAAEHAIDNNYAQLLPFIRAMVNTYATERW